MNTEQFHPDEIPKQEPLPLVTTAVEPHPLQADQSLQILNEPIKPPDPNTLLKELAMSGATKQEMLLAIIKYKSLIDNPISRDDEVSEIHVYFPELHGMRGKASVNALIAKSRKQGIPVKSITKAGSRTVYDYLGNEGDTPSLAKPRSNSKISPKRTDKKQSQTGSSEPSSPVPSDPAETVEIRQFFRSVPNHLLPPPDQAFSARSSAYNFYEYIYNEVKKNNFPDRIKIYEDVFNKPYDSTRFSLKKNYVEARIRYLVEKSKTPSPTEKPREIRQPQPLFPVFEAPKNRTTGLKQFAPPVNDELLSARINGLDSMQKIAAQTIFDRIAGKSISEQEWLESIKKTSGIPITPGDLSSVIHEINEDIGMKIMSYISGGVRYYYRRNYNI